MTPAEEPDAHAALRVSQRQFGQNAANYATSIVHAKGASLKRLVEIVAPQSNWHMLDIATAAGHTAFAFAPHVRSVVASDATAEMLTVASGVAAQRGIDNVTFEYADAHALSFDDDTFDLVTCRIAPHHFCDPAKFVDEAARVLRPGGVFALVDNLAPPDPQVAKWCDDFERRRDPSHVRCLPIDEWNQLIATAGLDQLTTETLAKSMNFEAWADNMSVSAAVRDQLLGDLTNADELVLDWLRPSVANDDRAENSFVLTEGLFVAHKSR